MDYTIKEASEHLRRSQKTILRWIDEGLKTVPGSKNPIYIRGAEFKRFAQLRNGKKKVKLERNQFYCLSCKQAVFAKRGSIEVSEHKKIGRCRACNGKIIRLN